MKTAIVAAYRISGSVSFYFHPKLEMGFLKSRQKTQKEKIISFPY
jgi:hypothetical protein